MTVKKYSRREFVNQNSLAGSGAAFAMGITPTLLSSSYASDARVPAILGGQPVRTKSMTVK